MYTHTQNCRSYSARAAGRTLGTHSPLSSQFSACGTVCRAIQSLESDSVWRLLSASRPCSQHTDAIVRRSYACVHTVHTGQSDCAFRSLYRLSLRTVRLCRRRMCTVRPSSVRLYVRSAYSRPFRQPPSVCRPNAESAAFESAASECISFECRSPCKRRTPYDERIQSGRHIRGKFGAFNCVVERCARFWTLVNSAGLSGILLQTVRQLISR